MGYTIEFEKNAREEGITLRLGEAEDLAQLLELHTANLFDNLSEEQRKDGYVKVKYSESDFLTVISHKEIVVASQSNNLIGYYMVPCKSNSEFLNYQKKKAEEIFTKEPTLVSSSFIGYGAQICIGRDFRNQGLFKALFAQLCLVMDNKYRLLLCSVSKTNIKSLERHTHLGWEIDSSDSRCYFLTYRIS